MKHTTYPSGGSRLNVSRFLFAIAIAVMFGVAGCSETSTTPPETISEVAQYNSDVPQQWFDLQLLLIEKTPGNTPPVVARALGYSGVALYEALVPGMATHRSLAGQLNGLSSVPQPSGERQHWPEVANSVMANITRRLFDNASAEMKTRIDSMETAVEASFATVDAAVIARSKAHGLAVADAIYEWSKTDGGDKGYSKNFPADFVVPQGPGLWIPTSAAQPIPLQPYWGKNRPFVLPKGNPNSGIAPAAPFAFSEDAQSDFYKEANEVYTTVKSLTTEQRDIALFWSDDPGKTCTPPGHSMSILCQCLKMHNNNLEFAAEACAAVGIAVADAFIACWDTKFTYNLIRPLSYIQAVIDTSFNRSGTQLPLSTPPFPEYTSGHSVQSGATAAVLTRYYPTPFTITDRTYAAKGVTRSFASFNAIAEEAAISRLYGGIHYRRAIEEGLAQGRKIGERVLALQFRK